MALVLAEVKFTANSCCGYVVMVSAQKKTSKQGTACEQHSVILHRTIERLLWWTVVTPSLRRGLKRVSVDRRESFDIFPSSWLFSAIAPR